MAKRYRNGWWLEIKYHEEGLTQREIGELCGVSARAIRKYMKEFDIERRSVEGENHGLYGQERDDEVKEKISETLEGREFDAETRERMAEAQTGRTLPEDIRKKISASLNGLSRDLETRQKMSEARRGEANPNWKGGHSRRYGPGWKEAREKVRQRDTVCQHCGSDGSNRRLEVHHIIPVRRFQAANECDLSDAHQLSNLVLLCNRCHPKAEQGIIKFESGVEEPN